MVHAAIVHDEALVGAALRTVLEASGDVRAVADGDGLARQARPAGLPERP